MQEKIVNIKANGVEESYSIGKVARQSDGSVLYTQGKCVILATVVVEQKAVNEPFLPLTVQYIEKAYASSKIPGGFIKRESKPSDFETLTSRIIDRSLRPLFPKDFAYPTVITVMVLSADSQVDLQIASLHAANSALLLSNLPIEKSVSAIRVGRKDNKELINPSQSQMQESELDLLLVGSGEEILMIEMAVKATQEQEVNEILEDEFIELIENLKGEIAKTCREYEKAFLPLKREKLTLPVSIDDNLEDLVNIINERYSDSIDIALNGLSKSERGDILDRVYQNIKDSLSDLELENDPLKIYKAIDCVKRQKVRGQILEQRKRADGRRVDEVRPITIETNILPSVHGSCLFTRGETQALATVTLGDGKDAQMYELLTEKSPRTEKFMVHYNFPPFSVGEARPIGAPSRRELGHGNLAKRALEPMLIEDNSQTVRLVSEILESNGSSSMATVCAGSLALIASEVGLRELVAGVAMGLVKEGDKYAILSDIMGLEDHDGDMDFKVTGTKNGMTAMQMDIKLGGLDLNILKEALYQAKEARLHILSLMEEAKGNITPSQALPISDNFNIDPSKIVHIIGKAGSTIREIIERFEVKIDLDRQSGGVKLIGDSKESVKLAREHIESIASKDEPTVPQYEIGKVYQGEIKRVMEYGLFVEMPGNYDALLHISKMAGRPASSFKEGDKVEVKVLAQNGRKVELALSNYVES